MVSGSDLHRTATADAKNMHRLVAEAALGSHVDFPKCGGQYEVTRLGLKCDQRSKVLGFQTSS